MPNTGFTPFTHYLVQAIGGVSFPTTKEELIRRVGAYQVRVAPQKEMALVTLLSLLVPEEYPCATALYCALASTMEKHGL